MSEHIGDPLREDFRNFMFLCFKSLNMDASPLQYDVGHWLQNGGLKVNPDGTSDGSRRRGVTALRNFGKSYITAFYAAWRLYCNPNTKILCVSANQNRAVEFILLTRKILEVVPQCNHLRPRESDRDGAFRFDCGAKTVPSKDPSVAAYGITAMIVGAHVDEIIADDVETPQNSETVEGREKLYKACMEFESVLNPGGSITYLGTPHHRDSIYNRLSEHYSFRRWPARYPDPDSDTAVKNLAPSMLADLLEGRKKPGEASYPERFPEHVLIEREAIMGPTIFAMQMMLDTALADADKYPLKLRDFIVMSVSGHVAPSEVVWGTNPIDTIQSVGLKGDHFNAPIFWSKERYEPYQKAIMFVDPAGTGSDETGYAVVKYLNGMLYVPVVGGLKGGHSDESLLQLAAVCKMHEVRKVWVESNFGDGMYEKLLAPKLAQVCGPIAVEGVASGNKQKELRIIDTLEPLMAQRRIVIDTSVAEDRVLMSQITNITRDRGSLKNMKDDRIEALAGACAQFIGDIGVDPTKVVAEAKQQSVKDAVRDFYATWRRGHMGRSIARGSPEYTQAAETPVMPSNGFTGKPSWGRPRWGKKR